MKKHLLQILTLCLCIALLVTVIVQGRRYEEYRGYMETRLENMYEHLISEIDSVSDEVRWELEEANRVVETYGIEPVGLDAETRSLAAVVSLELKQWHEDTEVRLLMTMGDELQDVYLSPRSNGTWSAIVNLPVEGDCWIEAEALISGGGMTTGETLSGWGDVKMLLPLYDSGGSWSGPEYRDGAVYSEFAIRIAGPDDSPAAVQEPEFRVYRNGELVQTLRAMPRLDEPGAYRPVENLALACDPGDVVEIHFRCVDEFGLGYDFPFLNWMIDEESDAISGGDVSYVGGNGLTLFWPE